LIAGNFNLSYSVDFQQIAAVGKIFKQARLIWQHIFLL
jgi:hypothetical protein